MPRPTDAHHPLAMHPAAVLRSPAYGGDKSATRLQLLRAAAVAAARAAAARAAAAAANAATCAAAAATEAENGSVRSART